MTRRHYPSLFGEERPTRNPGLAAYSGQNECHRCGEDIEDWRQATKGKGRWIHKVCAGGGDDE